MIANILILITRLITGVSVHFVEPFKVAGKQRVFYGNHSSHLDFWLIWSILPNNQRVKTRPVAGKDYWGSGFIKKYISDKIINAVLVHRDWKNIPGERQPGELLQEAIDQGDSLILFPEGTRSLDYKVKDFKAGIYHLAKDNPNLEFVPIYMNNLSRILPKGEFLPVPILTRAVIGKPFTVKENESKEDFLSRAKKNLIELNPSEENDV